MFKYTNDLHCNSYDTKQSKTIILNITYSTNNTPLNSTE